MYLGDVTEASAQAVVPPTEWTSPVPLEATSFPGIHPTRLAPYLLIFPAQVSRMQGRLSLDELE